MKALGLNPGEQEMIDMTNEVSVNGLIYYPEFCKLVLRKYREENRETLNQALFKAIETIKLNLARSGKYKYLILQVICGTDPYPKNFRAKKYKIKEKFFTKTDFQLMMRNLPVPVTEEDIDAMFDFADKDRDGKINYRFTFYLANEWLLSKQSLFFSEFETMINPKIYRPPPKFSFRNLKKYMPQIKEMARKEGVARENAKKDSEGKQMKADKVLQFLKDD